MRLIDADALWAALCMDEAIEDAYGSGVLEIVSDILDDMLGDAPTIDAVPVVRCKDCVHIGCDEGATWCTHPRWVQLDGYCANGERKEDEED